MKKGEVAEIFILNPLKKVKKSGNLNTIVA